MCVIWRVSARSLCTMTLQPASVNLWKQRFAPKFKELLDGSLHFIKMNCNVQQLLSAPKSCIVTFWIISIVWVSQSAPLFLPGLGHDVKREPGAAVRNHTTAGPAVEKLTDPFLEYLVQPVL